VLEEDCGTDLIVQTGGLDLWPQGAAIPMVDYTSSLEASGIPFEVLDAREVMRRWPQWRLDDGVAALFQGRGGIAPAMLCNAAHVRMAQEHGATLVAEAPVTSIRSHGGEIEVIARDAAFRCERLIVAADAWTNELLGHLGLQLPLTVTQEQITYWAPENPEYFAPDRFPVWIWMDDPSFYGVPLFGEAGVKAAQDVGGKEVTARTRTFDADADALRRVESFLETHLPSALGPVIYTKTCLYTMPPDRDFVIDSVPSHDNVFVALGAAHGYKFASLFGRIVADLATDGSTSYDISRFVIDRSALTTEEPVRSFMI
jgi:sarcosine oxidase